MEWTYYLIKVFFILLGIVAVLLGKFLPVKYLVRIQEGYEIINKKKYIKYSKIILCCLGFNFLIYGIMVMFTNGLPYSFVFVALIPGIIVIVCIVVCKKYIKKLND